MGNETRPVVLDCSSSALKLMGKLLSEGVAGRAVASDKEENKEKEIVSVGIGEHRNYDITKLLSMVSTSFARENSARNAVAKYRGFGGSRYDSVAALKKNDLDYRKMKACCRLFGADICAAVSLLG